MSKTLYTKKAAAYTWFVIYSVGILFLLPTTVSAQTCSLLLQGNTLGGNVYVCAPSTQPLPSGCLGAEGVQGMTCTSVPSGYTIYTRAYATFFSATPTTVNRGDTVSLAWQTQGAVGCSIDGSGANKSVNTSGTLAAQPQQSTTFVLSCRDASAGGLSGELRSLGSVSVTVTAYTSSATKETVSTNLTYVPLEPFPGLEEAQSGTGDFGALLQGFFKLLVNIGAFIAVTVLVIGGITYMVSEAAVTKFVAREKIKAAFWGLAILAGAWLILNTINPQLLTFDKDLVKPSPYFVTTIRETLSTNGMQEHTLSNKEYDLLAKAIGCSKFLGQRAGCLTDGVLIYDPAVGKTPAFQDKRNEFTKKCARLPGFRANTAQGQIIGSAGTEIAFCSRPSQ